MRNHLLKTSSTPRTGSRQANRQRYKKLFPSRHRCLLMVAAVAAAFVVVSFLTLMIFLGTSTEMASPLNFALGKSMIRGKSLSRPEPLTSDKTKYTWTVLPPNDDTFVSNHVMSSTTTPLQNVMDLICNPDKNNSHAFFENHDNVTICVNGTLPPFRHKLPHFVFNSTDEEIFMLQPENHAALQPDWVDWSWQTCFLIQKHSTMIVTARIVGMQSSSFQHFHDNALPLIYQSRQGLNAIQRAVATTNCPKPIEERVLYEPPAKGSKLLKEEWSRLGFSKESLYPTTKRRLVKGSIAVLRRRYPKDTDQVRTHPIHVQWLRSVLPPLPKQKSSKKVIWISRLGAQQGIFARQCTNEPQVLHYLRNFVGRDNLVVYNPSKSALKTLEELVNLFGNACALVGIHGGGLYNQFYAHDETSIIELLSVTEKGLIHGQLSPKNKPRQAHRAIWQNSNLIGQPYWRIHFQTDTANEFDICDETMEQVGKALKLAGCA